MPRYAIKVAVEAERLPDPPPKPPYGAGGDSMHDIARVMQESMRPLMPQQYRPAGASAIRVIEVTAESFDTLAKILAAFDSLAEKLECENQ